MQAYHGLIQHIRDPTERKAKSDEICAKVSSLRHLLSQKGFEVPVVREKNNMCLGVLPPPPLLAKEIRGKFTGCHVISCYICLLSRNLLLEWQLFSYQSVFCHAISC